MAVAQELLKDNKDNLEKKSGSLSLDERKSLDSVKLKDDVVKNAQETKFQVKTKQGREIPVSARVLMEAIARGVALAEWTNYQQKLQSADIKLKVGNNVYSVDTKEFGRWSELMAFLQVAAGGNLVPDGKFGQATADAFSKFVTKSEATEKTPEEIKEYKVVDKETMSYYKASTNAYKTTESILGKVVADMFKARGIIGENNKFTSNFHVSEYGLGVSYNSLYSKTPSAMSIKYDSIAAADWSIDSDKLLKQIKQNIDKTDAIEKTQKDKEVADKNAKTLEKSAEDSLDGLEVSNFTNPLIKEYLSKQYSWNGTRIDFDLSSGRSNGITVENGSITVGDAKKTILSVKLSSYKKADNTFDGTKFLNDLTNKMLPLAKSWKQEKIRTTFNKYVVQKPLPLEINDIKIIDKKKNEYKALQKEVKEAKNQGVVVNSQIDQGISKNIDQLNKQKNYISVKNWFDKDLVKYEDAANATGRDRLSRQAEKTLSTTAQRQYELFSGGRWRIVDLNLNPKTTYEEVSRKSEFDGYMQRYEKAAKALD